MARGPHGAGTLTGGIRAHVPGLLLASSHSASARARWAFECDAQPVTRREDSLGGRRAARRVDAPAPSIGARRGWKWRPLCSIASSRAASASNRRPLRNADDQFTRRFGRSNSPVADSGLAIVRNMTLQELEWSGTRKRNHETRRSTKATIRFAIHKTSVQTSLQHRDVEVHEQTGP